MISVELPLTIRFEDADPAGVVFYPRAIALAHGAVEELIRRSPLGWDAWFASESHAFPVRRAEADFLAPMKPGETFRCIASVECGGATSVIFVVDFMDHSDQVAARVRTIHVVVDRSTGKPAAIPQAIREAWG